jgi:hypothetical protein
MPGKESWASFNASPTATVGNEQRQVKRVLRTWINLEAVEHVIPIPDQYPNVLEMKCNAGTVVSC